MSDQWDVTAQLDKTSYNVGDRMTLTITGGDVLTGPVTVNLSGTINIVSADGATTTVPLPSAPITGTTTTPESVKIASVTDSSGRVWTVAPDGLSATATA